ncbi:PIN domain-containing protein [Actinomadura bangladeshensis]|uniref:PIN domain-containing protein n=1 Tax=Actinomadura bangladeshensis TaxID=453573 RepID=A0A4V2XN86_9ACTN|nr:PIN domain-containing protein [Actinomadura bangladeshensis]TDC17256.1 hypothetical protein E1284_09910 [Actinomadura bangladeshensis]
MYVSLLPGATSDDLLDRLGKVRTSLENLSNGHHSSANDRRNDYIRWVSESVAQLRHILPPEELDRLLMTPTFWHIHTIDAVDLNVNTETIKVELDFRSRELELIHKTLKAQKERWATPRIVIPDSSMFCEHVDKLEEWDLAVPLRLAEREPLHIAIPLVVVEELDRLKESSKKHTRWRAGYTTAVINRVLPDSDETGVLREAGYAPGRGTITLEVLMDRPGHVRRANEDAEIVDQAFAVNGLAGQAVTVLTYDTGQTRQARVRGLDVLNLQTEPAEAEPPREAKGR